MKRADEPRPARDCETSPRAFEAESSPRRRGAPSVLRRRFRKSRDRRDCLPIRNLQDLPCVLFFAKTRREYELRPREHVVSERAPPAIRRARAARPRESVPRAPPGRPPRVLGSRPRASSPRPSVTDHPNVRIPRDYARAEDLRRRDHGAGPHAGEAGASRRHARALVFRAPPDRPRGPARARAAPLDLRPTASPNASRTLVVSRHVVARGERSVVFL